MMKRILEQQQAICAVLSNDRKNWSKMPSDDEFTNIETVVAVLHPLSVFTDALSGEKWVNISAVRPLLNHILDGLLVPSDDDSEFAKQLKVDISSDLRPRYSEPEVLVLLNKCSFLNPRFRCKCLDDPEGTKNKIADEGVTVLMNTTTESSPNTPISSGSHTEECQPPLKKKRKGLGAILTKKLSNDSEGKSRAPLCPQEKIEAEITRYLDLPVVDDMDSDPLEWWKHEAKHFLPVLAVLAKKYVCICGTSVPSERLFSKSGYITNALRRRLLPEKVNTLTFLPMNLP